MSNADTPMKIASLLNSQDMEEQKMGYEAFMGRTHWKLDSTADDLKNFACNQLNLKPQHVIASIKRIEPATLFASQDGLESDKLKMVEAAYGYFQKHNEEFPPVVVWNFFESPVMRLVIHDGHHRSYFCHRFRIKLRAVVLEPLGNYSKVEDKFRYAFQIQKRCIDLPVMRVGGVIE